MGQGKYPESSTDSKETGLELWNYKVIVNAYMNSSSYSWWYWVYLDGSSYLNKTDITGTTEKSYSIDFPAAAWERFELQSWVVSSSSSAKVYYKSSYLYQILHTIPVMKVISWYAMSIVGLWNLWYITIFWLQDTNFYMWEETTTATTWSITPWNFVWYLQIWDYKIPYYL